MASTTATISTLAQAENPASPIHPDVRIGHVHLKVADLQRALDFYTGVLGFALTLRIGDQAAFLSAGGYHHHIGLNTWESQGGHPPPPGTTGLYHLAILYPTRAALADALRRLVHAGVPPRRRERPRRQRSPLPARPRRQRRRTLLGPSPVSMAPHPRRQSDYVHPPPGPRRPAARNLIGSVTHSEY